jgi:Reverse transcriptase (RNA-dependent DNA polymerase)
VLSDTLQTVDEGDMAVLTLVDPSAALGTVDHRKLLRHWLKSFGFDGPALQGFRSFLSGRTQTVRQGSPQSAVTAVSCGIPYGAVLGSTLFILYTSDFVKLIERHGFSTHLYADDTYSCYPPSGMGDLVTLIPACTDDILSWMRSNKLQLNADKTELVIWCATSRQLCQLPATSVRVGSETNIPS